MAADSAEILAYLPDVDYPVSKDELVNKAEREGAGQHLLTILRTLPVEQFVSAAQVRREIDAVN
jgi:hypothetical protein